MRIQHPFDKRKNRAKILSPSLSLSLIDQTERNRFDVRDNLTTWRYLDPATIPNCAVSHISEKFHGLSALEKWIQYLSDQR